MRRQEPASDYAALKASAGDGRFSEGQLATYLAGGATLKIGAEYAAAVADRADHPVVLSAYQIQDIADYRGALQAWFARVALGGVLVVIAPHAFLYERQNALPSRWNPGQKRLYTPASLMGEVEEALVPNTYRVRYLGDQDTGYDYSAPAALRPAGRHEVAVVLEKIVPPSWGLSGLPSGRVARAPAGAPENVFEPARTRVERDATVPATRILLLKLDHLGDFIMGVPALERARAAFPDAEITLVVGSWNLAMATALGLFDRVLTFDAFPRNSSEERADVRGVVSEFHHCFGGGEGYDLAIDLRSDGDTRVLLEVANARLRAALGARTNYPFLDIFLPVDHTRADIERAWEEEIGAYRFSEHGCWRNHFEIFAKPVEPGSRDYAMIWGPYRRLPSGRYRFEPFSEVRLEEPGILHCDVALDTRRVAEQVCSGEHLPALDFVVVTEAEADFEYRVFTVPGEPTPSFRFYGGRLIRQGSGGVLHQSEYLSLLVELVAMRVQQYGVLQDHRARP